MFTTDLAEAYSQAFVLGGYKFWPVSSRRCWNDTPPGRNRPRATVERPKGVDTWIRQGDVECETHTTKETMGDSHDIRCDRGEAQLSSEVRTLQAVKEESARLAAQRQTYTLGRHMWRDGRIPSRTTPRACLLQWIDWQSKHARQWNWWETTRPHSDRRHRATQRNTGVNTAETYTQIQITLSKRQWGCAVIWNQPPCWIRWKRLSTQWSRRRRLDPMRFQPNCSSSVKERCSRPCTR